MSKVLLIFFACLLFSLTSGQQRPVEVRHGTIIVWEVSAERIIIAADSRVFSEKSGKLKDEACKIISLAHDTLFFYTGNLAQAVDTRTGKEIFSQEKSAQEAYLFIKAQPRSYERLAGLAKKYSELARPKMNALLKIIPDASERIGLAGFASLDESKHPRLVLVNIPITVPNNGAPAYTSVPDVSEWPYDPQHFIGTGYYAANMGVLEFLDEKTERAKRASEEFESRVPKLPKGDVEVYWLIAAVETSLNWESGRPKHWTTSGRSGYRVQHRRSVD